MPTLITIRKEEGGWVAGLGDTPDEGCGTTPVGALFNLLAEVELRLPLFGDPPQEQRCPELRVAQLMRLCARVVRFGEAPTTVLFSILTEGASTIEKLVKEKRGE